MYVPLTWYNNLSVCPTPSTTNTLKLVGETVRAGKVTQRQKHTENDRLVSDDELTMYGDAYIGEREPQNKPTYAEAARTGCGSVPNGLWHILWAHSV